MPDGRIRTDSVGDRYALMERMNKFDGDAGYRDRAPSSSPYFEKRNTTARNRKRG
jgi:hypothetical protein